MSRQIFDTKVVAIRPSIPDWEEWVATLPNGSGDVAYHQMYTSSAAELAFWYVGRMGLMPTRFLGYARGFITLEVVA